MFALRRNSAAHFVAAMADARTEPLTCLVSSGRQWLALPTPILPCPYFEIDFEIVGSLPASSPMWPFGYFRLGADDAALGIQCYADRTRLFYVDYDYKVDVPAPSGRTSYKAEGDAFYVNGSKFADLEHRTNYPESVTAVFGTLQESGPSAYALASMKLYSFVYGLPVSGAYSPALLGQEAGLMDAAGNFYGNKGQGTFGYVKPDGTVVAPT